MANKSSSLGVTGGRLTPCPGAPNCVCSQDTQPQSRIEPIPFADSPAQALQRIKAAVAALPRMKIVRETDDYLHVEARSRLFRFVDDVEFYVDAPAKLIHFRSASRLGYADFGVNRARMEQFREMLKS